MEGTNALVLGALRDAKTLLSPGALEGAVFISPPTFFCCRLSVTKKSGKKKTKLLTRWMTWFYRHPQKSACTAGGRFYVTEKGGVAASMTILDAVQPECVCVYKVRATRKIKRGCCPP